MYTNTLGHARITQRSVRTSIHTQITCSFMIPQASAQRVLEQRGSLVCLGRDQLWPTRCVPHARCFRVIRMWEIGIHFVISCCLAKGWVSWRLSSALCSSPHASRSCRHCCRCLLLPFRHRLLLWRDQYHTKPMQVVTGDFHMIALTQKQV